MRRLYGRWATGGNLMGRTFLSQEFASSWGPTRVGVNTKAVTRLRKADVGASLKGSTPPSPENAIATDTDHP